MWDDIKTLLRLEYKQVKQQSRDGLLILGIDHEASYGYLMYVVLFFAFWVFAMWSYIVEMVYNASQMLDVALTTDLLNAIPASILVFQVIYFIVILRGKPLKLTVPNMAYMATSPVSRGAVGLVYYIKSAVLPLGIISTLSIFITMFFVWALELPNVGLIGLLAFPLIFGLGVSTTLIGWCMGLAKQIDRARWWRYWLMIPLVILLGVLIPFVMLWDGRVWVNLIQNSFKPFDAVILLGIIAGLGVLLVRIATRIDMTIILEDSQIYARIQKLGVFGQMIAPDVISSIKSQAKLAKRQVKTSKFPRQLWGTNALVGYNMVNIYRLSPSLILQLLFSGITYPSIIILVMGFAGFSTLQAWALILIIVMQMRPKNVTRFFQEHHTRPHLRQFLPVDNLTLFLTQTALPLAVTSIGLGISIALRGLPIGAFFLGVAILLGLALCQVQFDLSTSGFRIAYEYQVLFFGAVVIASWVVSGDLWAVLGVVIALDLMIASGIKNSKRVSG